MGDVDFSLLRTPDFASAALGAYQAGAALGRQKRTDAALAAVDLSRPETIMQVVRADPQTGAALLQASSAMAKAQHETAGRAALADYLPLALGLGGATGAAPSGAAGSASATGAAPEMTPLQRATGAFIQNDPEGFLAIQKQISDMDETQQKRLAEATDAFAVVGNTAKQLPYAQRAAYIQSQAGYLAAHGVTPDHISGFDPTDFNIGAELDKSLGTKEALARVAPRLFAGQPGAPVYDQNPNSPTYSMGGGSGAAMPTAPVGKLTPIEGGAASQGAGTFPIR